MNIRPIAELTQDHQGKVVLLNVREFARCKGQMGRPWGSDEGPGTRGTNDPYWLREAGFTHFVELAELERLERAYREELWGPLTQAEENCMREKYSAAHQVSE